MTTALEDLEITAVALVDNPANPLATVELFKRDFSTDQRQAMADRGQAMPDGSYPIANRADLMNAIHAYGRAKNPAAVKAHIISRARALGCSDLIPDGWVSKSESAEEHDDPKEASVADSTELEARIAELEAERTALTEMTNEDLAALRGFELAKRDETEDVMKNVPEDIRKRLEDAEAAVAKMQKDARDRDFIAKAAEFGHIAGAAEFGPVLEEIDRKAPEAAQKMVTYLKAAEARIAESNLFAEFGATGSDSETPGAKGEALIEKYVGEGMARPAAVEKVLRENPDLFVPAKNA